MKQLLASIIIISICLMGCAEKQKHQEGTPEQEETNWENLEQQQQLLDTLQRSHEFDLE